MSSSQFAALVTPSVQVSCSFDAQEKTWKSWGGRGNRARKSAGGRWSGRIMAEGRGLAAGNGSRRAGFGGSPSPCASDPVVRVLSERILSERILSERSPREARSVRVGVGGRPVEAEKNDYKMWEALMVGGEQVAEIMKEVAELLEDIAGFGKDDEEVAVRMAVAGAIAKKLDRLEGNFMMALDWMIRKAEKEKDDKKELLELIKETILGQLSEKAPSQVQVVGALCTTSCKDARQEILRRCAGGGGIFKTEKGGDLKLPAANLKQIADQADDIIGTMEEKPLVPDRRLLAKLILAREEARSLMGGGILDERNDNKGFQNLPESEVKFLTKIMALKPGPQLREKLSRVMRGKDEGEEKDGEEADTKPRPRQKLVNMEKDAGAKKPRATKEETPLRAVRPGMFLETLTKVLSGMYESNTVGGVTVQQLEWIHRITLDILQEIAYF